MSDTNVLPPSSQSLRPATSRPTTNPPPPTFPGNPVKTLAKFSDLSEPQKNAAIPIVVGLRAGLFAGVGELPALDFDNADDEALLEVMWDQVFDGWNTNMTVGVKPKCTWDEAVGGVDRDAMRFPFGRLARDLPKKEKTTPKKRHLDEDEDTVPEAVSTKKARIGRKHGDDVFLRTHIKFEDSWVSWMATTMGHQIFNPREAVLFPGLTMPEARAGAMHAHDKEMFRAFRRQNTGLAVWWLRQHAKFWAHTDDIEGSRPPTIDMNFNELHAPDSAILRGKGMLKDMQDMMAAVESYPTVMDSHNFIDRQA